MHTPSVHGRSFHAALAAVLACALAGCRTNDAAQSLVKDSPIVTPAPEDQRGTAFCWAYAIVAHLEQRYYERTRGAGGGGFRLNFSEEYLGLIHLVRQLREGKAPGEGLRLSESLALVERYGIVPESVGGQTIFRAKFDEAIAPQVDARAQAYWAERSQEELSPVPVADALRLVADAAALDAGQRRFLAGALQLAHAGESEFQALAAIGAEGDARFQYAGDMQTPRSWAKARLKFAAGDYFVLRFPDSGRGQYGDDPLSVEYRRAQQLVQKALLYGYSVPISFNFVEGSEAAGGVLRCRERACWDASIATPTASAPHANHAVLLIDYRTPVSRLEAPTEASVAAGYDAVPSEWVIKNSWGFNANTSSDPELLRRFPLPAYTLMAQDFFEASHKLVPDRYEALLPREVCLRDQTPDRAWVCEAMIKGMATVGVPAAQDAALALDAPRIVANLRSAATSRYPVELDVGAPELAADDASMRLVPVEGDSPDALAQVSLARETVADPDGRDTFRLCIAVAASDEVRYAAVYLQEPDGQAPAPTPGAVLSPQGGWRTCQLVRAGARTFKVVVQALDKRYKATGQITATVRVP